MAQLKESLLGDVILAAGNLTYLGPFTGFYRSETINKEWIPLLKSVNIQCSENFTLSETLGDPIKIKSWNLDGLPDDQASVENVITMNETMDKKWPLMIDPQNQAILYIKNKLKDEFEIVKLSDSNFMKQLEACMIAGKAVILENVDEKIDPSVMPLIGRYFFRQGKELVVRLNDRNMGVSEKFQLYVMTGLPCPHFKPEVQSRTTMLNFAITPEGLEQQLLSMVCLFENKKDEEKRDQLIRENAYHKSEQARLENEILDQLKNSGDDILNDEKLLNSLNESKIITQDIEQQMASAKMVEERIENNRAHFTPVSQKGAILFFAV